MKNLYKLIILIIFSSVVYTSCDLEEDPPYLSEDSVYNNIEGADVALNGIFSAFAGFNYYSADFHHAGLLYSGLFYPGKPSDRNNIGVLNPGASQNYPTNLWRQCYVTIARANDLIANTPEDSGNDEINNIIGIAYFLRAHSYFNLVRFYGEVPIHTEPANSETLHKERASLEDVFTLILSDGEIAKSLMLDAASQRGGRPGNLAANMLLAKVYMQMAGNDNSSSYWQNAYDEAIEVVGRYSLVPDYADLWNSVSTSNNNSESIFEIQFNEENSSVMIKIFTDGAAYPGKGWKRFRPNPETIDMHMDKYPDDPRIALTFLSEFEKYDKNGPTGNFIKTYPLVARSNDAKGFPYVYKYFIKDQTATTDASNFNYRQYRYADLLLMLGEIENELGQTDAAMSRVNEVLARARNTGGTVEPADWTGLSQDEFRVAIMREYQFELLAEGQDWFNTRRRGYEFFNANYIMVHNNRNEKPFDLVYPDNSKAMLLPIPLVEINTNQKINAEDQNPGY